MPDIQLSRAHTLGLPAARQHAQRWGEKATEKFGVQCEYEPGDAQDLLRFSGNGVDGRLVVTASAFELEAELGFLAAMFKDSIEAKLNAQFDELLTKA
ncbi:polyhydroxyalkanoic acid system family protein [Acidovorax sp. Be4]|uniref:Polyhydroxyalkanoic acid system family protein n=1 Tax=Acidovorax bellezanensis TaxID=2976702 RepID=A0ABT2PMK1_9BURK|nr:polyhydroxyalkanoic acid system family protein [Acidovorax sp. Be4]MCT9810497.1 polyhydroxyalkanoic acid system family protein [Acidovorax sp. Be4]